MTDTLSLLDVVRFFRRNWALIFGFSLIAAALGVTGFYFFAHPTWESSATLVVVPPKFTSRLKPATLTIQGYQKLLESDSVVAEAKKRLVEKKILSEASSFRVGQEIQTRIFVSRRAEETTLAPLVRAVAYGKSGAQAAAMANTWVHVFLERVRKVMEGSTSQTVQFIEEQYPLARSALLKKEKKRVETLQKILKKMAETSSAWEQKIVYSKNKTTEIVSTYEAETDRLVGEYRAHKRLITRNIRFQTLQKSYSGLLDEQAQVTAKLQKKELELHAAQEQLGRILRYVTLKKTITDDALWKIVAENPNHEPDWTSLSKYILVSEEINPVYIDIQSQAVELAVEVASLRPRFELLTRQLEQTRQEMKKTEVSLRKDETGLERIKLERTAGLATLKQKRETDLENIERNRDEALKALRLELDTASQQLDREVKLQRDLFGELAKHYNQAILAKAQEQMEDIRLASPAVPPDAPMTGHALLKTLLAAILGGFVGLCTALFREAGRIAV